MATPLTWLQVNGIRDLTGSVGTFLLRFYLPGTTTPTTVYSDVDELSTISQPLSTDAYGKATVCTTGPVKIVVRNSADTTTLYTIERAEHADEDQVDIQSSSFTSAGGVAGDKVVLGTVLDRVVTSFGGTDWKYKHDTGWSERTLKIEFQERGLNVKSAGAAGDGTTIDTAAINRCLLALKNAGGGTMIWPKGTYLIDTAALVVDFSSLEMKAQGTVTIKQNTNNVGVISLSASVLGFKMLGGFTLDGANAGSSAAAFAAASSSSFSLTDVSMSPGKFTTGLDAVGVSGCTVNGGSYTGTSYGVRVRSSSSLVSFLNMYTSGGATAGMSIEGSSLISINGCNLSGGGATYLDIDGTSSYVNAVGGIITSARVQSGAARVRLSGTGTSSLTDNTRDVASASTLAVLGRPVHNVTGTTTINNISKTYYDDGETLRLKFAAAAQVTHAAGGTGDIRLSGAANWTSSADDTLQLTLINGVWWETGTRVVI